MGGKEEREGDERREEKTPLSVWKRGGKRANGFSGAKYRRR